MEQKRSAYEELRLKGGHREIIRLVADLFDFDKRVLSMKQVMNKMASRTKFGDLSEEVMLTKDGAKKGMEGLSTDKGIIIDRSISTKVPDRTRLKAILLHETIHDIKGLGNNELVTANALGNYLHDVETKNGEFIFSHANEALFNESFHPRSYEKTVEKYGRIHAEYLPAIGNHSFAEIGRLLAKDAIMLEKELKKPGLGLIIISEMSKGHLFRDVVQRAQKGGYDEKRRALLKRHPSIKRLVERGSGPGFLFRLNIKKVMPARKGMIRKRLRI